MTCRDLLRINALALFALAALCAQNKAAWKTPRTADGHPDLQGIWNNSTRTPLERPAEFAGKATVTDAQATDGSTMNTRPGRSWTEPRRALCIRPKDRREPVLTTSSFTTWVPGSPAWTE